MKSLDKVFKIIELLRVNPELGLKDLSGKLEINKSTTYRMLSSLAKHNYIEKNTETKKYKLSIKFAEIGYQVIQNLDIIVAAKELIDELNKVTKVTIHLAKLIGNEVVYIDKRESLSPIRLSSQIGRVVLWHCTGVGKAILAYQPKEFQERIIKSLDFHVYTENTISNREDFIKELEMIKKTGYATDREENQKNVGCIAAPIYDHAKNVVASISITFIFEKLDEQLSSYKDLILKTSMLISRQMGYKY